MISHGGSGVRVARAALWGLVVVGCGGGRAVGPPPAAPVAVPSPVPLPAASSVTAPARFRLRLCSEAPVRLPSAPGARQSRGCVATFTQTLSDPATIRLLGTDKVARRYLVYAPANLPSHPVPVVLVFPGYSTSAESVAFYSTNTRFETLADRDGFIVVYGNGLPNPPNAREKVSMPKGGFLQGCFAAHAGEGIDVQYVRQILASLQTELEIDKARVYATGMSAGGGMSFVLALEAPDLVAAIAPVVPVPFEPRGLWLFAVTRSRDTTASRSRCSPPPMIRSSLTAEAARASTPTPPTRAWRRRGTPGWPRWGSRARRDDAFPTSFRATPTSRHRPPEQHDRATALPAGAGRAGALVLQGGGDGTHVAEPDADLAGLWERFGKTNQDLDFADEAWAFFQRHARR